MDVSKTPPLRAVELAAIERIGDAFGVALTEIDAPSSGQGRVAFAKADGRDVVIKWSSDADWIESLPRSVAYGEALRQRGYPTPAVLNSGAVQGVGAAMLQERIAGEPSLNGLNDHLFEEVLGVIELQANAHVDFDVPDLNGWSWDAAVVFDDEAGWWAAARQLNYEVEQLCNRLHSFVEPTGRAAPRSDWVTLDFNFGNILNVNGRLSGIVDLDHLGFGDRSNDLLSLAFGFERLAWSRHKDHDIAHLEQIRDRVFSISGEAGWRQAVTYRAIAALGWQNERGMRVPLPEAEFAIEGLLAIS